MSRWKGWALAGAGLALCLWSGCHRITVTAANSLSPVMFGPRKTFGIAGAKGDPPRSPNGKPFRHEETTVEFGLSIMTFSVSGEDASTNSLDDKGGPVSSPQLARNDDRVWLDWRVLRATGGNPARRIDLTSIRCEGYAFFFLTGLATRSSCELDGFVSEAE